MNQENQAQNQPEEPRKIREDETTQEVERELLQVFLRYTQRTDLVGQKLPRSYRLDYALYDKDGTLRGWVECKGRAAPKMKKKYDNYMLAFAKWKCILLTKHTSKQRVYLVVGLPDAVWTVEITPDLPVRYGRGGRIDRRDPEDIEPCVYIPMSCFRQIAVLTKDGYKALSDRAGPLTAITM